MGKERYPVFSLASFAHSKDAIACKGCEPLLSTPFLSPTPPSTLLCGRPHSSDPSSSYLSLLPWRVSAGLSFGPLWRCPSPRPKASSSPAQHCHEEGRGEAQKQMWRCKMRPDISGPSGFVQQYWGSPMVASAPELKPWKPSAQVEEPSLSGRGMRKPSGP
jgi:hypothetical protein